MTDEEQEGLLFGSSDEDLSDEEVHASSRRATSRYRCLFCSRVVHHLVCGMPRMCYTMLRCCRTPTRTDSFHNLDESTRDDDAESVGDEEEDYNGRRIVCAGERTPAEPRSDDAHDNTPYSAHKDRAQTRGDVAGPHALHSLSTLDDQMSHAMNGAGSVATVAHDKGHDDNDWLDMSHDTGVNGEAPLATTRGSSPSPVGVGRRGGSVTSVSSPRLTPRRDAYERDDVDDYDAFMHQIESARAPIRTIAELTSLLERCRSYLPIGLQVELDGYMNAHTRHADESRQASFASASTTASTTPTMHFCLHVLGPLHILPTSSILSVLEDVLLDDCDAEVLSLSSIRCSDLDLSRQNRMSRRRAVRGDGVDMRNNNNVNNKSSGSSDEEDNSDADGANGELQVLEKECHTRLLVFVTNVMRTRERELSTVWFTRCMFRPPDMGNTFPLNVRHVRRLLFEQCPLAAAHVEMFLYLAQQSSTPDRGSFAALQELQLSGSLTEECVADVLDYFDDEMQTKPLLRVLRLPVMVCRSIRKHHFLQSHPYIEVVPNQA